MTAPTITQELLQSLFCYDPETGILTNRQKRGGRGPGTEAGRIEFDRSDKLYRRVRLYRRDFYTHRLIWLYVHGDWPEEGIDHIDGDGLNNRLGNLRSVSRLENQKNLRLSKNNTSGHSGVVWHKGEQAWRARITCENKRIEIGSFADIEDAIAARKAAEISLGFHPNHGKSR